MDTVRPRAKFFRLPLNLAPIRALIGRWRPVRVAPPSKPSVPCLSRLPAAAGACFLEESSRQPRRRNVASVPLRQLAWTRLRSLESLVSAAPLLAALMSMRRGPASRFAAQPAGFLGRSRWELERHAAVPRRSGRPWVVAAEVNLTQSPPHVRFCTRHDQQRDEPCPPSQCPAPPRRYRRRRAYAESQASAEQIRRDGEARH